MEHIESYLSYRKQIIKFDDVMSDAENILFGVPKTLLFLIYINHYSLIFPQHKVNLSFVKMIQIYL